MAELKIESYFDKNPDCLVLKLQGSLDLFTFAELKGALDHLPEDPASRYLAVDLSAVSYVASSGWGVMMSRAKALRSAGGMMVVYGLNSGNKNVYETLNIMSIMPEAPDLKQAKELLANSPD